MRLCKLCKSKIELGVIHNCVGPSLQAPWLHEQNEQILAELQRIREALEAQPQLPLAKAQRRETRG